MVLTHGNHRLEFIASVKKERIGATLFCKKVLRQLSCPIIIPALGIIVGHAVSNY